MRRPLGLDPRAFDTFYKSPLLGIDEVGTGAIAGPICVSAVVLPDSKTLRRALHKAGLRDSKEMTGLVRERVSALIEEHAEWRTTVFAWCWEIEEEGQGPCLTRLFTSVMTQYLTHYATRGDILLDGDPRADIPYQYTAVQKGDRKSQTISAASVLAKVARDDLMHRMARDYPGYGFEDHVGYYTRTHREALERLGPCEIHRRNTKPVKTALSRAG